jgi:hypothetical protein
MKLVKLDEVFVKLKEISNPGHPHDSYKCGCPEGRGGVTGKNRSGGGLKKKNPIFDGRDGQLWGMTTALPRFYAAAYL